MKNTNTPYDDVVRTLMNDCKRLLVPLVNEIFKKSYEFNTPVIMDSNEHFITQQDGKQEKRISDSNFSIGDEVYQIECQSTEDGSMMIRIWEYGSQIALRNARYDDISNTLYLKFPNTAVLYLRSKASTPEFTQIHVEFPEKTCEYQVPNIKMLKYSIDDIFNKKLYFFIPFYLFVYEKDFSRYNNNEEALVELESAFEEIFKKLDAATYKDMSEYERATIIDMSKKIIDHLAKDHINIKKGLGDVMGGKVIDHRAKDIKLEAYFELILEGLLSISAAAVKMCMPEETLSEKFEIWKAKNIAK